MAKISKDVKAKKPKAKTEAPEGFTSNEQNIISHFKAKKRVSNPAKKEGADQNGKIGSMFKKKAKKQDDEQVPGFEVPKSAKVGKQVKPKFTKNAERGDAESANGNRTAKPKGSFQKKSNFKGPVKRKADGPAGGESPAKKPNWKELKQQKQTLKTERKMKEQTTRYELSIKAKKLWEELRKENIPEDKQQQFSTDLYGLVKGHMKELIFAHDTARVIECLFGSATSVIKQAVFDELKPHILEISKSLYAHFYVLKVLRNGTKEQREFIINSLSGKVVELMKHKIASKIVETAYNDWANAAQRAKLSQEFYGPEFKLFKDEGIATLDAALKKYPQKKDTFLQYMSEAIQPVIDKGVFNHSLLHRLLSEYMTHCSEQERAEMIQNLREGVVQMLHTRDGARIGMLSVWHGTPKDRKAIAKSFKSHVTKICQEEHGHLVLLSLLDSMDDTKFLSKVILNEIASNLKEIAFHEQGRKVIFYLVAGRDTTYTHPQVLEILKQGDGNAHSKKDAELRRKELLEAASPFLLSSIAAEPLAWLKDNRNILLLSAILKYCAGEELDAAWKSLCGVICGDMDEESKEHFQNEGETVNYWVEQSALHMVLKKLIQNDKQKTEGPRFSSYVLEALEPAAVKQWITCNRGAFLLVFLMETGIEEITAKTAEKLQPVKKLLAKQENKGASILAKKLNEWKK